MQNSFRRIPRMLLLLLALAVGSAPLRTLSAQQEIVLNSNSTLSVGKFTSLTVSTTSLALNAGFAGVRATDYAAGSINSAVLTIRSWSNTANWNVTITPTATGKPLGDFSWARTASCAAGTFTTLGAGSVSLFAAAQTTPSPNAGVATQICVRTALSWTGDPASGGAISLPLRFTVAAP